MTVLRVDTIAASGQITENTGSVFFDGTGDFIKHEGPDIIWNVFASDACTFECWLYVTDLSSARQIFHLGNKGDFSIQTDGQIRIHPDESNYKDTNQSINVNTWYHIALVQESGRKDVYINGVKDTGTVGGGDPDGDTWSTEAGSDGNVFYIGDDGVYRDFFHGYMSNVRVVRNVALYTSNFTPPTRELEVTPETVLVCCHDGENIFAEKTGKIIAAYGDRLSSPTPTATNSPIGITTFQPGLTRGVDVTAGPVLQGNLEYNSQNFLVLPKGTTTERFPDFGAVDASSARGIFFGGGYSSPTLYDVIDYVTISTTGNAQDFGNLTLARSTTGACSSLTRGVCAGGFDGSSFYNLMDYVTISSTGNAQDFGDLSGIRIHIGGCSNSIRGIFGGGWSPQKNIIEYITISSTGNAFDFGDLTTARFQPASFSSTTRGIFAGGTAPPSNLNTIDYITIASTGNAVDFGDLNNTASATGLSNSTRGLAVFTSGSSNAIDFVTIASLGNATDFGDQTVANRELSGSFASSIRGVIGGGSGASTGNVIDYVTIAQTGNAQDFGDLTQQRNRVSGCSNGHGGLG